MAATMPALPPYLTTGGPLREVTTKTDGGRKKGDAEETYEDGIE